MQMLDQYRTQDEIDPSDIKTWFESNYGDADYEDVFGPKSDYDNGRKIGYEFLKRSAIGEAPKVLLNGYILDDAGITGDKFEETVMMEVMRITPKLQAAVINGHLKDRVNVGNWIMEQKDVMPRHNARILDSVSKKNIVDFGVASECKGKSYSDFVSLGVSERTECLAANMKYLRRTEEESTAVRSL
ncbi:hypothetical protein ANCDUO_14169 [Ancylostoma duodenale]|uniref:UGGT thioredoxin-like domain-containing protein n=1 Tax=Ancylostoma duodenale TaxID=51022 RepID=A0A0C2CH11_9BILA|nr:hypothetical protein ANCDUO_14169 [Ancylostoma duodenale]